MRKQIIIYNFQKQIKDPRTLINSPFTKYYIMNEIKLLKI